MRKNSTKKQTLTVEAMDSFLRSGLCVFSGVFVTSLACVLLSCVSFSVGVVTSVELTAFTFGSSSFLGVDVCF